MPLSNSNNKNLSSVNTVSTNTNTTVSNLNNADTNTTAKQAMPAFLSQAVQVFTTPGSNRKTISSFLRGKSGVYCFFNNVNGKFYIGSGVELSRRINLYLQNSWLDKHTNMLIVKAINKYGIDNFSLFIVEFCDVDDLLSRETFFITTTSPDYNIFKIAGSPLGFKHAPESILKIREAALGRTFSQETLERMSEAAKNRFQSGQPGSSLSVLDLQTGTTTEFQSIAEAARRLGLNRCAVTNRLNKENTNTFKYKGRYVITVGK
uniref:GIY-YIG endonuclease family protein n=1 Tax=Rhizoctonia solani TaxID=456999 RepID=N0ACQ5_9AGAM|nr:GIY-YIG endonuclease family protein [Rhizoctonia solani]AGK45362.1 GIY-YIG endonuclease family protein [Rhizoctonia solani]